MPETADRDLVRTSARELEVRLLRLAPVSQEMVLNHISTSVLGLPKSY